MKYIILTIMVLLTILYIYGFATPFSNQYDDSYITYRYAVNLANGNGLVFNAGERTDAASSFLYTVILAGFYKIGLQKLPAVSGILSILSLLVIALMVYRSLVYCRVHSILALAFAYVITMHGFVSGWALSGMETTFYTALLLCFIYTTFIKTNLSLSFKLLILLILTRHDAVIILPFWTVMEFRAKRWKYILSVAAFLSVYYGCRYVYYGTFIPHAMQFKQIAKYYQPNPTEMFSYWYTYCSALAIVSLGSLFVDTKTRLLFAYAVTALIVCAFGMRADLIRYSVPLIPVFGILGAITLQELSTKNWYTWPLIAVTLFVIGYQSVKAVRVSQRFFSAYQTTQIARHKIGILINEKIPVDETIISHDIGMIGYTAINHRFIDLCGLVSSGVLENYRAGKNADIENARYIADTFEIQNNSIVYKMFDPSVFINKAFTNKRENIQLTLLNIELCNPRAIALTEIMTEVNYE